jgi:hypothetical protein
VGISVGTTDKLLIANMKPLFAGGEGIRTHGMVTGTTVFETVLLRSALAAASILGGCRSRIWTYFRALS